MLNTPWSSTINLSIELAAQLITSQFPEITIHEIFFLGEGWDNQVFKVNGSCVFRFPRRDEGVILMKHEISVMPELAKHLHVPISYPRFIGYPSDIFPYPFAGYDFLEGVAVADLDFSILPETDLLPKLAFFLKNLHSLERSDIPAEITEDIGRMDYEPRVPAINEGLDQLEKMGHKVDRKTLLLIVENCAAYFPALNTCLVHGDLHPRHILIQDKKLSGIIDWGDMSFGCKAMDLSSIYTLYPRQYHQSFWDIYGEVPEAVKQQALFRAIYSNVLLGVYALDKQEPVLLKSALQGLENCGT